jgi:hypothetical protein
MDSSDSIIHALGRDKAKDRGGPACTLRYWRNRVRPEFSGLTVAKLRRDLMTSFRRRPATADPHELAQDGKLEPGHP